MLPAVREQQSVGAAGRRRTLLSATAVAVQPALGGSATVIRPAAAKPSESLPHGNCGQAGRRQRGRVGCGGSGGGSARRCAAALAAIAAAARRRRRPTLLRASAPCAAVEVVADSNAAVLPAALALDDACLATAATACASRRRAAAMQQGGPSQGGAQAGLQGGRRCQAVQAVGRGAMGSRADKLPAVLRLPQQGKCSGHNCAYHVPFRRQITQAEAPIDPSVQCWSAERPPARGPKPQRPPGPARQRLNRPSRSAVRKAHRY